MSYQRKTNIGGDVGKITNSPTQIMINIHEEHVERGTTIVELKVNYDVKVKFM